MHSYHIAYSCFPTGPGLTAPPAIRTRVKMLQMKGTSLGREFQWRHLGTSTSWFPILDGSCLVPEPKKWVSLTMTSHNLKHIHHHLTMSCPKVCSDQALHRPQVPPRQVPVENGQEEAIEATEHSTCANGRESEIFCGVNGWSMGRAQWFWPDYPCFRKTPYIILCM